MVEHIKELQDMEKLAKQEKERANKWSTYFHNLKIEHSKLLREFNDH